uniref:Uncharacterized protein n=1 Tax=Helianthus annuus TaxID=4232 RepID=A0A251USI9_HELAN
MTVTPLPSPPSSSSTLFLKNPTPFQASFNDFKLLSLKSHPTTYLNLEGRINNLRDRVNI